jgi:hypothetical protein
MDDYDNGITIITNASFRGFRVNVKSKAGGRRHARQAHSRCILYQSITHPSKKGSASSGEREGWSASGPARFL